MSLPEGVPPTHTAIATPAARAPLTQLAVPTHPPAAGEVLVRVAWTASTPLDLHQADGGLLVTHPQVLGDGFAGRVVAAGPGAPPPRGLEVGDEVFGFAWRDGRERAHQEYVTVPTFLAGKIPRGVAPWAAVTVPNNLVTAFNVVVADLGLALPWPRPEGWAPERPGVPVLVWGAASSVGQYVVQVLRRWGYANVLAVASARHHADLRALGAAACFDYREADVARKVLGHAGRDGAGEGPRVPLMVDCIGSVAGTLEPLAKIAERGTVVAVMLPVIVRDATAEEAPEYEMDVNKANVTWADGVVLRGVRTHHYLNNEFFKEHLQPEIMPALLESGVIKPNKQKFVEGETMLERAEKALALLRSRDPSGERLVWRVCDG